MFVCGESIRGAAALPVAYRELAQGGYAFVAEDIRGRNGSGGTFVTNRAQNDSRNAPGTNESTDAYDTIDWLVKSLRGGAGHLLAREWRALVPTTDDDIKHIDGAIRASAPMHTVEYDTYVADPAHPVPYMPRPDDGSAWSTWMQQDQRFVVGRPDVLT